MLQLQWESQRPISLALIWQIRLLTGLYFSIFSRSLSHTLMSPGIAASIIIVFFFTLSTTAISSLLVSIMWSYSLKKSHRIFKFLFWTTLSGSCSYQSLALLNASFSHNCQFTYFPTVLCLYLYCFWASLPLSLTIIWDIVSFLVPHMLQKGEPLVLLILYLI